MLLNANLNIVTQRHTAAHELGHHVLHHRTAADDDLSPALRWGNGSWPDEEKTAEAFAAGSSYRARRCWPVSTGSAGDSRPVRSTCTGWRGSWAPRTRARCGTCRTSVCWTPTGPASGRRSPRPRSAALWRAGRSCPRMPRSTSSPPLPTCSGCTPTSVMC
ncbi:hypothetical protein ABZZ74_46385 [Streptomyces sp. NPDC006476]|uniref:ImmA/IrrE family metallo-endopeptidase n=1 Tax=Streptomyces sp. NPDC006476 TaxID=3157175 RepID=UPI0033BF5457